MTNQDFKPPSMQDVPANPYAPVDTAADTRAELRSVRIVPVAYPDAATECSYFTFPEFAEELTQRLVESCTAISMKGLVGEQLEETGDLPCEASIRCYVREVKQYHLSGFQRIRKWLLPIGYYYSPATFVIDILIVGGNGTTRAVTIKRHFGNGRLGEKANMTIGICAEAMRIVKLAADMLTDAGPPAQRGPFWTYVLLVPLCTGLVLAGVTFVAWGGGSGEALGPQSRNQRQIDAVIHAVLAFLATAPLAIAFAPGWIYSDSRAAFAYRFAGTSKSLVVRSMFLIVGLVFGMLFAASLISQLFP